MAGSVSDNSRGRRGKKPIAYIVSMGAGIEAFIYREIEALCERGYSIVLFATRFKAGDVFSPKAEWSYHVLPLTRMLLLAPVLFARMLVRPALLLEAIRDRGLVDLVFATYFSSLMKREGVGQIHCHFGDHKLFIGYYCKRITGLPLTVTIHAHEFYTNPNVRLFRKALAACDRIFPIARRWCELLEREYDVPASRIRLNRLFVDTELYRPVSPVKVIAAGRFTERKGFQDLLQAACELGDLDIHFIFVGFGEIDLRDLAQRLGISRRVTVFGKMDQEQLRFMYQDADILCVPSITTEREGAEGIPVVLMEGMACGLPVVATNCGAIDEIVETRIVDEGAPSQLAREIRELALDPELRKKEGRRNRRIVEKNYSSRNAVQFSEWLDEVASGRG
ncbi:MAG TPA: colanic acid biosynthesis glycosyltransferase WcaL [Gammaproteobacteria bacterium]|nr:colanic acid biosynthesis glycosyltransferase WcaL [Gammaproteobacteria bacterium]